MDKDRKNAVNEFLKEFKGIANSCGIYVIPRRENIDALLELNINKKIRKEEILSISVCDYCSGPEEDRDGNGYVWIFGKSMGEIEIYIKLKIAETGNSKIAKCLSFHKATHRIPYYCLAPERRNCPC